jgi:hypothetical protein
VAPAYGRQTERAAEIIRLVGYVAGGLPGQRLLARLSIATSDDTVLRRVRQPPVQPPSTLPVHNLGVDDWAWRKGQDFGTILVNLDLRRVVDLIPDRAAESFSAWLRQHPEIVTISRDRCGLYAEGATLGAPQSQQIADRFHLILNLSATMERVLEERSRQLVLPHIDDPAAASQQPMPMVSPLSPPRVGWSCHPNRRSRNCADNGGWSATRKSSPCLSPASPRRLSAAPWGWKGKRFGVGCDEGSFPNGSRHTVGHRR